jgi:hypothetical protein
MKKLLPHCSQTEGGDSRRRMPFKVFNGNKTWLFLEKVTQWIPHTSNFKESMRHELWKERVSGDNSTGRYFGGEIPHSYHFD